MAAMRDIIVGAANLAVLGTLRNTLSDMETFWRLCRLHLDLVQAEDAAGALSERTFSLYDLSISPMTHQQRTSLIVSALANPPIPAGTSGYGIYRWLPPDYVMLKAIVAAERRLLEVAAAHEEGAAILAELIARLEEFLEAAVAYDDAMH